jgi:alkyldihydroxyacetonephosphate synthase
METSNTLSDSMLAAVAGIVGEGGVSTRPSDVFSYNRDLWPKSIIWLKENQAPHAPSAIVWPASEGQIVELVKLANAKKLALIPFGAGSGVCGGTLPVGGGVILDVKRLNRIGEPDTVSMTCEFEPGVIGMHAEMEMERQGLTIGHFPSSIICSSVGGWIAARGAGQESSRYGKIEDMVVSLRFVTGAGEVVDTAECGTPDQANAPNQLLIGSEGTLGVITGSVLRIHRKPAVVFPRGTIFPNVAAGVEAMRRVFALGIRPTVVRLYDEFDTIVGFGKEKTHAVKKPKGKLLGSFLEEISVPGELTEAVIKRMLGATTILNKIADHLPGSCMLVTVFSGDDAAMLGAEVSAAHEVFASCGGKDQGEGPGLHWLKKRYAVSYKQSKIFYAGGFCDTMEVAAPWDRIMPLYAAVKKAVSAQAFIMAHFSHAYADGCSIYFTFVGPRREGRAADLYDRIWERAQEAVIAAGATISHHHGVGVSKARFLPRQHEGGMPYYRAIKRAFDPNGVMNPGKLGLTDTI